MTTTNEAVPNEAVSGEARRAGLGVSATGLRASYGPVTALAGVDVDIAAGERVAITGASGSGKSTLLLTLAGVLRPDAGTVRLGEADVTALGDDARARLRRSDVGILFQYGQLVEDLSCARNVALPLVLRGVPRAAADARALEALERFSVASVADQRPGQVSGGQRQRVALARAVVADPAIIFADEPTGALDSVSGEHVMTELVTYAGRTGATLVLVTHDATVAAYVGREIRLRDGVVVNHG